ncbi:hypothetical protein HXZ94_15230 [Empedobacter falsenii]|uniref:hypothetical protein n=1 Tax=Empedobacter falsenii TaxID=343874 RepID=UPI0025782039|nr:hypothetical protein [Empedobacter falsenii]MDM1299847.1 hypothetical protein [Empedobacter falsenii]MDM1319651.1 hypothetical protein [Empedobacter falsenii]
MNALLSIILNKSFFYNKKIAILFFISLSLVVLVTFFDKGFETNRGDLFLITTLYFGISICLYRLIKEKNYEFQKYTFNVDEYRLSLKKDKKMSYNVIFNRLLSEDLYNIKSEFSASQKIDEFLFNIQNELTMNLRKLITFERFDNYFTYSNNNKTTSKLFYFQYKKSLIKIIKDFIVNTNELEDIPNEIVSRFISELTNHKNLYFNKDLGLHYEDMFAINFLEDYKKQELTNEIEHQKEISKDIKQVELKNISKTQFYKVLEKTSIDVLKVQLTKENKEELKSYVGVFFSSEIDSEFQYKPQIKQLSFINLNNSIDFILSIKYLIKSNLIVNNMSRNMQNLDKVIAENAYKTTAKDRAGIFRNNLFLIDFSLEKQENIDYILQTLKVKPK